MKKLLVIAAVLVAFQATSQEFRSVDHFTKVMVGPHVELVLEKGEHETVTLTNLGVEFSEVNVKVSGNTLMIYLDDARIVTKHRKEKHSEYGYKSKVPVYKGTQVTATVSYNYLHKVSLRGEERYVVMNPVSSDRFKVKMYGEGTLEIPEINAEKMKVKLYGDNELHIEGGKVTKAKYKAYGENEVHSDHLITDVTKSSNFGENSLRVNASDRIKWSALGESVIGYKGVSHVDKGIVIGENESYKIRTRN